MRILFGLVIGIIAGFAAATWFYGQGGNIVISGQEVFPRGVGTPIASATPAAPSVARPPSQPGRPRQVVRDVSDEPPASPPAQTAPAEPAGPPPVAAAPSRPVTRYEITSDFVILVPRI